MFKVRQSSYPVVLLLFSIIASNLLVNLYHADKISLLFSAIVFGLCFALAIVSFYVVEAKIHARAERDFSRWRDKRRIVIRDPDKRPLLDISIDQLKMVENYRGSPFLLFGDIHEPKLTLEVTDS